jgi:hypothetical protein
MKIKKSIHGILVLMLSLYVISACNKSGNLSGPAGTLVASSYKVKINQPDTLLLNGAKTTDTVHWSVTPAGCDSLITKNNAALIFFKKAGVYQVKALDNGLSPAMVSITVSDSVYQPPVTYISTPLIGDQITLLPFYHTSSDSSYLQFIAVTKNFYCSDSQLLTRDSLVNGQYGINLLRVEQPSQCTTGQSPLSPTINFTVGQPAPLGNGAYPLSVTLNGTTYTGSIVVTTTTITYNWNYTSGVLISPKQVSR